MTQTTAQSPLDPEEATALVSKFNSVRWEKALLYTAAFFEASAIHGKTIAEYARHMHWSFRHISKN